MARSRLTPLGALAQGLAAGAVGTAAMDLVQFARYKLGGGEEGLLAWEFSAGLEDWEHAPAPAGRADQQLDSLGLRDRLGWAVRAGGGVAALPEGRPWARPGRHGVDHRLHRPAAGQAVPADLGVRRQGPGQGPRRPAGVRRERSRGRRPPFRALTTGATRPRFQWQAVTVPLSIRHAAAAE